MKTKEAVIIGILAGCAGVLWIKNYVWQKLFDKEHELLNQSFENNEKLIGMLMDFYGYSPEQKAVLTDSDFIRVHK